jgi:hypothetical protein
MSVSDFNNANPLSHYADLQGIEELFDTVKTVTVAGRNWKYYRIEVVRRFRDRNDVERPDFGVLVYIEDLLNVQRTMDDETYYPGQTRILTRWTNFPDVSEDDPEAALHSALVLLQERAN